MIDFSKYSSIKIGPKVEVAVINEILNSLKDFFIIGGANNLLISNNPPPLAMLSKRFDYIFIKDNLLYIGGATKSAKIVSFAKKEDLANFEMLHNLPGTIGGIVKMNAGLKNEEIFNHLIKIKTGIGYISKEKIKYGYRYTDIEGIVYEAVFEIKKGFDKNKIELFKKLRLNQPKIPSAGSCFKNPNAPYSAGYLLEKTGLKGYKIGNMAFSKIHANFLVNLGEGTYEDAINLINLAKKEVFEKLVIKLESEIVVL